MDEGSKVWMRAARWMRVTMTVMDEACPIHSGCGDDVSKSEEGQDESGGLWQQG